MRIVLLHECKKCHFVARFAKKHEKGCKVTKKTVLYSDRRLRMDNRKRKLVAKIKSESVARAKEEEKEEVVYTKPLTDKQQRFAELVAHGVDKESAYITAYNVGDDTKPSTISSAAHRLVNNVAVLKEIDRIREVNAIAQTIDKVDDEKRLELLRGETTPEEAIEDEWNQKTAFKKLRTLLQGCEESLILLKERPKIFGEIVALMNEVRVALDREENDKLFDLMDNIQALVYKVGAFDAKEYNSTIQTANSIMKTLNDITGVTKNAKQIENETFEKKLLSLISNMDTINRKKPNYVPLKEQMEDYAFDE